MNPAAVRRFWREHNTNFLRDNGQPEPLGPSFTALISGKSDTVQVAFD